MNDRHDDEFRPQPALGVYGRIGFDYVIVDTEHSPTSRGARPADRRRSRTKASARSFVFPRPSRARRSRVSTPASTACSCPTARRQRKFTLSSTPRACARSRALHAQARDFGTYPSPESEQYLKERNANVVVIIGIESVPAIENLEDILKVPGIDAIFIGPNDLSISLVCRTSTTTRSSPKRSNTSSPRRVSMAGGWSLV